MDWIISGDLLSSASTASPPSGAVYMYCPLLAPTHHCHDSPIFYEAHFLLVTGTCSVLLFHAFLSVAVAYES